jgi:predicted RNA-binding protein YlxR (DUF448 family)
MHVRLEEIMAKVERGAHKQFSEHGQRLVVRSCVVCRQRFHQASLVRLVKLGLSGAVALDPKRRAVGRGYYICSSPACRTEKALLRVSRVNTAQLATDLETHWNPPSPLIHHRVSYELISPSATLELN